MPQENNPSVINDYAKKRACRLLSLDAGHNGFCQIYFLQELFHRLKFDLHSEEEPRPCDWFDMIIGSGHGGLLAILLGRLCMPVSTALHTYHKLTKAITNKPTDDPNERKKNMQLFITAFTDVLKSIEFDKDTLLEENGTNRCKVIICVLDGYTNDGKHLRNFDFRNETGSGGTILEAACATIADLRSYNPVDVGDDSLCYNARLRWANPVQRLLRDAQITFGRDVNVSSIISVGPGERTEMNDSNSYGLIKDIIERIATDTEPPHQLMLEGRAGSAKIYTRHNSFCAQVHVNPAKAKSSVLSHLETYEGRKELDQAVSNLLNQEGKHSLKELNVNPLVGNGRESTQKDSRSVDMSLGAAWETKAPLILSTFISFTKLRNTVPERSLLTAYHMTTTPASLLSSLSSIKRPLVIDDIKRLSNFPRNANLSSLTLPGDAPFTRRYLTNANKGRSLKAESRDRKYFFFDFQAPGKYLAQPE